jgi:hypothetical protein
VKTNHTKKRKENNAKMTSLYAVTLPPKKERGEKRNPKRGKGQSDDGARVPPNDVALRTG